MTFLFWFAVIVALPWASYLLIRVWTTPDRFADIEELLERDR